MKKKIVSLKKRFKKYLKTFYKTLKRPEMSVLPGHLAFFFVLSVVPIVTLISYGASYLHVSIDFVSNFVSKAFSSDIAKMLSPIMNTDTLGVKFFISLVIGFFIASNGADSIIVTSNAIYKVPNSSYPRRRLKAIIMTFFIVTLFMFILLVPVFGNMIVDAVKFVDLNPTVSLRVEQVFRFLKGPISWFVMFMFIKIIYSMAPDRRMPSSYTTRGALFTTVLWIIGTAIYSYYITHFARYDLFYGGLANLVILMLWVYFLAYIFVTGMCMNHNSEIEKLEKTGEIKIS